MTINKYMLDAQYGVGANGKNLNNGLSSWFTWSWNKVVFVDDNSKKCKVNANSGDHGDINIDIAQPSCTYRKLVCRWTLRTLCCHLALVFFSYRRVLGRRLHSQDL